MTLTYDPATWFLFATYHLIMMIICVTFFKNPTTHDKVIGRTRTGFTEAYAQSLRSDCDLDFNLTTWPLFAIHRLILIIICAKLFSNSTMHNTVIWVGHEQVSLIFAQSFSADCDLDLWPSDMVLVRDTSSCHDDNLYQIIFKSHYA